MEKKSILIRATPSPLDKFTVAEAWKFNLIHNNSGNVAFPYGLIRNLTSSNVKVDSDWYGHRLPSPDEVNERYSHYILPMANDLGQHFESEMKRLTSYISKLKIPVVVVGIGGAFGTSDKFDTPKPFDSTVKRFFNEVLERSQTVGLRGHITARYMESLGFKEGSHFRVIGDPTLYNRGRDLYIKPFELTANSRIAYNMTPTAPMGSLRFLNRLAVQFENAEYIAQDLGDLTKMYSGILDPTFSVQRESVEEYPNGLRDYPFTSGKSSMYLTAPSWIAAMEDFDLSIGTRIHGNILPTHAGVPTVTLSFGSRLTELVEFHSLPHVDASSIDEKQDLRDVLERVDLQSPVSAHPANFDNFLEFLAENSIENQYDLPTGANVREFDRLYSLVTPMEPVRPIVSCRSVDEVAERLALGQEIVAPRIIEQKLRMVRLANEVRQLRPKVRSIEEMSDTERLKLMRTVIDVMEQTF